MTAAAGLLEPWMLGGGRPEDRARAEACGWLADAAEAAESALVAAEQYEAAGVGVAGGIWRDPSTRRHVDHAEAFERAANDRAKRHADAGAADPLAAAVVATRRALVLAAGWHETLSAAGMQDAPLYVDPTAAPDAAARATHTLAVAASIAARRARGGAR